MLRDKGLVKETDKVADYLSEFFPEDVDPKWYEVTLENMLQHRNGGTGGGGGAERQRLSFLYILRQTSV